VKISRFTVFCAIAFYPIRCDGSSVNHSQPHILIFPAMLHGITTCWLAIMNTRPPIDNLIEIIRLALESTFWITNIQDLAVTDSNPETVGQWSHQQVYKKGINPIASDRFPVLLSSHQRFALSSLRADFFTTLFRAYSFTMVLTKGVSNLVDFKLFGKFHLLILYF
jgi:hypothetical protein